MSPWDSSASIPQPLRVLVTWPIAPAQALERALALPLKKRQLSLDRIAIDQLKTQLKRPGYYHIWVIPSDNFARLSPEDRQRYGKRVNLLILIPGGVSLAQAKDWLACSPGGIAFSEEMELGGSADFVATLCTELLEQQSVILSVTDAWQKALPNSAAPYISFSREDQAIWPTAANAPDSGSRPSASSLSASPVLGSPGVVIHTAVFGTLNQANGDQINIIHSGFAENITQQAGGDQVNLNRPNRRVESPQVPQTRKCPDCGEFLDPPYRFCQACGKQL